MEAQNLSKKPHSSHVRCLDTLPIISTHLTEVPRSCFSPELEPRRCNEALASILQNRKHLQVFCLNWISFWNNSSKYSCGLFFPKSLEVWQFRKKILAFKRVIKTCQFWDCRLMISLPQRTLIPNGVFSRSPQPSKDSHTGRTTAGLEPDPTKHTATETPDLLLPKEMQNWWVCAVFEM